MIAQDGLKTTQEAPKDVSRGLQEDAQHSPMIFVRFHRVCAFSSLLILLHPKIAQEASNVAPRQPKRLPRTGQEDPKIAQAASTGNHDGPIDTEDGPRGPRGRPQDRLRGHPDGRRATQATMAAKMAQDGPMTAQDGLKTAQEAPKTIQESQR